MQLALRMEAHGCYQSHCSTTSAPK